MTTRLCVFLTFLLAGTAIAAPGYYRQPSLHGNTVIFTAEGDIWRVSLDNPTAMRLTTHPAEEHSAVISPDGSMIAFAANYSGTTEVYVMPMSGGVATRVSFENSSVKLHQWHAEGIVYATNSRVGPTGSWVLKVVDPTTLNSRTLPLSDAVEGRINNAGNALYFTQFGLQISTDNAHQYNGGATGEIWRFRLNQNREAEPLTATHAGSVREPMIADNMLFFVSNQSGMDNIWSMSTDGSDQQQITQFSEWAVRDAMLNKGRIIFQHGADLKILDLATNRVSTVEVSLVSDFPQLRERWVNQPLKYLNSARYTSAVEKVTITARGRVAVASTDSQRLVEIATDPTSRTRQAILSHDGKWVYALNDASGEMEIWQYAADGSPNATQLTNDAVGFRWNIYPSPDGQYIAHDDKQGNLWLLNLATGENRNVLDNNTGIAEIASLTWSADSQMLAITHNRRTSERPSILLYSVAEQRKAVLTSEKYESFSPAFSPDGQWLYFLSNREFNATPSSPWGDRNMGTLFDRRTLIYALALNANAQFPFQPPTELTGATDDNSASEESAADDNATAVTIDWSGLNERLWQVPVPAGNYTKLAVNDSFLYVIDQVLEPNQKPALKSIAIKPKTKLETFTDNVADYQLGSEGKSLFVRKAGGNNDNQFIVSAGAKFPADSKDAKLQTKQWKLAILPQQEWQQIFRDTWLMQRDSLFDANMRGLDWQQVYSKYSPLLARLTDRHELNDIFEQMMGELNALHSQVRGGDTPDDPNKPKAASLGGTFADADEGVEVTHIYRHDPELPAQASPLNKPGVDVVIGDVITHVNGMPISNTAGLVKSLRNQAGQQVLLTIARDSQSHQTVVKPVSANTDFMLRYNDWVQHNGAKVADANDDIGYLHLYAMGGRDVASFAREFYAQYQKAGLIIDVRRNRGGNVDAWILEKLLKRAWMFWQTPNGEQSTNMQQTFRGHLVVLADEFTYSDGETFTAGIKALDLGTVIGKQTAGAGVWLSGRNRVVDNGISRVAEYPVFAMDGRWIVEGSGVAPDIEVSNPPHATFNGEDAQLQAAIDLLQQKMQQEPIPAMDAEPLPSSPKPADVVH
ncbi:S41 family peptidase [Alteromonas sp. ASW11-36]|uniref:Tricorn protease homolog n=1 Tax=Alteromonas arenosi TaxID=3055817 RepID=A0ABT7T0Y6_9ALTE|nr:S41 family peptidase [Alteromonas sp. ASW11-36]MDM7862108.1 S41 family peptidase [Alteromonas sp. ASW11-36]